MRLIVGLGNPGDKYKHTRHNVGFIILDGIALKGGYVWELAPKFFAETARTGDVLLIKPQTFMNKSGESVSAVMHFYKIPLEKLVVVHDDVDLEFGRVKMQIGAGSAGHKGVESIMEVLGTKEFRRLRIGVGRPQDDNAEVEDWVLQPFSAVELTKIAAMPMDKLSFAGFN